MLKRINAQRNFSAGEVDDTLKRDDDIPQFKMGLRQCQNFRITDTKKLTNRLGRSIKFIDGPRVDEVLMSPGNIFYLVFGNGRLSVRNAAGATVFTTTKKGDGTTNIPWTTASAKAIVWDIYAFSIYITYADGFPTNVPQVLTWDGVSQASTWTLATFAESIFTNGQKRTPFLRLSPPSVTMLPSAALGSITLTFSSPIAVAGMVGTRMQYIGKQVLITAFIDASHLTASVVEVLPSAQTLTLVSDATFVGGFSLGDVVLGATSGAKGIVTSSPTTQTLTFFLSDITGAVNAGNAISGGTSGATGVVITASTVPPGNLAVVVLLTTTTRFVAAETITFPTFTAPVFSVTSGAMTVQLISNAAGLAKLFTNETISGPTGSATISAETTIGPQAVSVWDEEVMNNFRGWPSSVTVDQSRLVLMNFPAVRNGISYSAIGIFGDFYVPTNGLTPASAIFELAPNKSQILFMAAGMESSEFIFCDNAVYGVPINQTTPLSATTGIPFNKISDDGCASVQPRRMQNTLIYVNAGGGSVRAIMTTGAYYRANESRDISEFHNHLFNNPIAIACPTANDPNFPERYFYVLNSDGTMAVGKVDVQDGQIRQGTLPGWVRESSGNIAWVSARGGNVMFTTTYQPGGAAATTVAELRDFTQYLDAALPYNSVPAALTPPGGKGPLWWIPNGTVTVMDLGTRQLGLYSIDANGFLIPQNQGGENLASSQLVVGQAWTATVEPFVPSAEPGQDLEQRMVQRKLTRTSAYYSNSTGFIWQRLFSGPLRPGGPALGSVLNTRRVLTYNQDDDATKAPPLRDEVDIWRPSGVAYDPRIAIVKDTAGPLNILEIGMEISV